MVCFHFFNVARNTAFSIGGMRGVPSFTSQKFAQFPYQEKIPSVESLPPNFYPNPTKSSLLPLNNIFHVINKTSLLAVVIVHVPF